MGSLTETLRLVVDADTGKAIGNVERLGAAADKSLSKSKSGLDKVGSTLTKAGAGMIAFGSAALFGLGKMAMMSEEANLATVKLENTLKNMPKLAGENADQFIDLAEAIQDKTAADADSIVEAEAMLGTFNLTAKQIKGIIPLVVDFSRKFGVDMPKAAVQIGKALDGSIGALKKNGVSIDEVLYKTDRYAAVQKALSDQVGGFAEEEGKTFAGSLERLKNQIGDLAEGVGSGAVDAFTDLFGTIEGGVDWFNDLSPQVQNTVGKVATFASVAIIAAGAASTLIGQVIKARDNFGELAGAMGNVGNFAKAATPLAVVAGVVTGLDAAFDRLFPIDSTDLVEFENNLVHFAKNGRVVSEMADVLGKDMNKLGDAFKEIFDTSLTDELSHAAENIESVGGLFQGDKRDLEKAKNLIDDLDKSLASLAQRNPEMAAEALDRILKSLKEQGVSAGDVKSKLNDYNATLTALDTQKATSGVEDLGDSMDDQGDATSEAEDALREYTETLRGMFDPLFAMQDSLLDTAQAQQRLSDATAKQMEAQDEYNKAVARHGENSKAAKEAAAGLADANMDLEEATVGASKSTIDLAISAEGLRQKLEEEGYSGDALKKKLYDTARSMGFTDDQARRMAGGLDKATFSAKSLDRVDPRVTVRVNGIATTASQMQRLKDELASIDGRTYTARVVIAGTSVGVAVPGGARMFHEGGVVPGRRGEEVAAVLLGQEEVLAYDDPRHSANLAKAISAPHMGMAGGGGTARVVIDLSGGDDRFLTWLKNRIRVDGAGDVQVALGQRR